MKILEIRKISSKPAKLLSIFSLLASAWAFQNQYSLRWVFFSVFTVLLWVISEVYFGLRLKRAESKLQIGFGLGKLFLPQEEFFFHEVKGLLIMQQPDSYYGIGLTLISGNYILLEKVDTLDKAKARQLELTEEFDKALIQQRN